jgi:hypothetical protein
MDSVTRISDLPENITLVPKQQQVSQIQTPVSSYAPIDAHPNPYGHPPPSVPSYPAPSFQQSLPPRDIPKDSINYTNDAQVQPNYIPPLPAVSMNISNEYMMKYEQEKQKEWKEHAEKKRKQSRFETIIENSQIPIFVALLFFIFHMPIVNNYIFRKFSFLSIYDTDGNFNTYGLLLKSALFGFIYYFFSGLTQWLSEI